MIAFSITTGIKGEETTHGGLSSDVRQSSAPSVGLQEKPWPDRPSLAPPPAPSLAVERQPVRRFRHSGRIGDIIYSLPAVRALRGGEIYLRPEPRLGFTRAHAEALLPLLQAQSFLGKAKIWEAEPYDVDLDAFRAGDRYLSNLAQAHLTAFGLDAAERNRAWLRAPKPTRLAAAVFARSLSRRGIPGFWEKVYEVLGHAAVFVGSPEEHRSFESLYGSVPYAQTANFLELAELIAGADIFVGNQSAPYAVAEGLKKPAIQETYLSVPNCMFDREDCLCVRSPKELDLIQSLALRYAADSVRQSQSPPVLQLSDPSCSALVIDGHSLPATVNEGTKGQLGEATLGGASVVVLAFNSATKIGHCLQSVIPTLRDTDELIVVDNGSTDETAEVVRSLLPQTANGTLIENRSNIGFSAGCNAGLRASRGSTVILLNPDATVRPGWLEGLERRLANPKIGAVGPVTDNVSGLQFVSHHLAPSDGRLLTTDQLARRVRQLHAGESIETKLLIGFCIALRREVLNQVGLLDEDLYLGGEDLEMSLRLRSNGYTLFIARDVFVHHAGGASFATLGKHETQDLLAESTRVLHTKLKALFSPAPVPSSVELFGSPILPPELLIEAPEKEIAHAI